jgi:hypothetical protein
MSDDHILQQILERGLDDWIQAAEIVGVVVETGPTHTDAAIRTICLRLIRRILTSGLMTAGDVTVDGFRAWMSSPAEAYLRIESEWPTRGTPGLGDVCWLSNTLAGDAIASRSATAAP